MVMGPDCGTAIVNGLPLGFANVVRRGPIGVVGASGTGTQEVTVRIHQLGSGISQALGTGGHDLSRSHRRHLDAARACTRSNAIPTPRSSSWSPSRRRRPWPRRVLDAARGEATPVVVIFLGADPASFSDDGVHGASYAGRRGRHGGGAGLGTARRAGRARPRPGSPRQARRRRAAHGAEPALRPRHLLRRHVLLRGAAHRARRRASAPGPTRRSRATRLLDDIRDEPREHDRRHGRRRLHAGPAASDDRPVAARRAHPRRDAADPTTAVRARSTSCSATARRPTRPSRLTRGARPRPRLRPGTRVATVAVHRPRLRHRRRSTEPQEHHRQAPGRRCAGRLQQCRSRRLGRPPRHPAGGTLREHRCTNCSQQELQRRQRRPAGLRRQHRQRRRPCRSS